MSVAVNASNQLQGYSYDAAGNMTVDNNGTSYVYDAEDRIAGVMGFTYTYDADGNRVEKSNGTGGTLYWYMTIGIVAESDLSGNLQSEYVFFNGERLARKDFPGNTVSYYFSDHLHTASVITNATGAIKSESDYYPWGGELQFANADSNHYKFTGKERDAETGLDYFGARHYSNGLGRFITPDWAAKPAAIPYAVLGDPQTLNLYTYVRNVPTVRFDPDGHLQQQDDKKKPTPPTPTPAPTPAPTPKPTPSQQPGGGAVVNPPCEVDCPSAIQRAIDWVAEMLGFKMTDPSTLHSPLTPDMDTINLPSNMKIPLPALNTLGVIDDTGKSPANTPGGSTFRNDGRGGGQMLPPTDGHGNAITYREWDVNSRPTSGPRDAQRLVTGSDGSAYYTGDHYQTFEQIRPGHDQP